MQAAEDRTPSKSANMGWKLSVFNVRVNFPALDRLGLERAVRSSNLWRISALKTSSDKMGWAWCKLVGMHRLANRPHYGNIWRHEITWGLSASVMDIFSPQSGELLPIPFSFRRKRGIWRKPAWKWEIKLPLPLRDLLTLDSPLKSTMSSADLSVLLRIFIPAAWSPAR